MNEEQQTRWLEIVRVRQEERERRQRKTLAGHASIEDYHDNKYGDCSAPLPSSAKRAW